MSDAGAPKSGGSPERDRELVEQVRRQVEEADRRAAPLPERVGRYRILDIIGRGGMGVVYRAVQDGTNRVVALKVIRPELVSPGRLPGKTLPASDQEIRSATTNQLRSR